MRLWEIKALLTNLYGLRASLAMSRELYSLGRELFELLNQTGLNTDSPSSEAILRMSTRSLNLLHTTRRMALLGNRIGSIVICSSIVEFTVYVKWIEKHPEKADEWLKHDGTRTLWPVTGDNGLCKQMSLDHLEKAYRLLCLAKHAAYKGSGLDSSKILPDGGYTLTFEPVIDNEFFVDILGKTMDAVRVNLYDTASVLGQDCDKGKLNRWQQKLDRFTTGLRKALSG